MNRIATATETTTVVRIGKGLTLHAQAKGVETAWAACGTTSRTFGAARQTTGIVSCQKCLDAAAAEEAPVEEAPVATVEAVLTGIIAEVAATTPAAEVTFEKGDIVTDKDGERFTVRRTNANGSIRLVDNLGNKVNRKAANLTKA